MKPAAKFRIVLITAPDLKTARSLASAALEKHLIACVNLVPGVESHYRWRGKIETSGEILLILKTVSSRLSELEKLILDQHPYDTPEFLVFSPAGGGVDYLNWLQAGCAKKIRATF